MSTKEIFGYLTIIPDSDDSSQSEVQTGNVFFKSVTRRRTTTFWDTNASANSPQIRIQPWKMASLMVDDNDLVGHSFLGQAAPYTVYPHTPPSSSIATLDFRKFRATGTTTSILSSTIPRVIGSVGAIDGFATDQWQSDNTIISLNDVPLEYTQIGIVYQHPMVSGGADLSTTSGASYVSFADLHYLDSVRVEAHCHNILRISTGADAGMYLVRFVSKSDNRLYLMNLDGSLFVGQATASGVTWQIGHGRRAFFMPVQSSAML